MPQAAYISRRVVLPGGVSPAAVIVDTGSGQILHITEADTPGPVDAIHHFGEDALLPGFIDTHVHINEPGRTEWEGFGTGTRAAAAGGITTVVDMPLNCLPETTTVAALELKRRAAAGQCTVDWRAWGGAVGSGDSGNEAHLLPLASAGVPGFKAFLIYPGCDGLGLIDEAHLRRAMPLIARTGLPLLVHAELPGPIQAAAPALAAEDWRSYQTYLASRPDEAELEAIRLMIMLCRESGCRVHIVHLASAQALPLLRAARAQGLPITVETCPHYLHFSSEHIPPGATLLKCAPPIRNTANREALWQALEDGTIDLIASDHSPSPPQMKQVATGNLASAWGGIASLSLSASVLWSGMTQRGFTLPDLARLISLAPSRLAGLAHCKGQIAPGLDADLTVFTPEETFTVTSTALHFRHPISPYVGERLTGRVQQTILRGHAVYTKGSSASPAIGREVRV